MWGEFMFRFRGATLFAVALTFPLLACGETPEEGRAREMADYNSKMAVAEANVARATANFEATKAKIAGVDQIIATAQNHNGEDPAKMEQLISACQAQLGVSAQGAGSVEIMNCVNERW